MAGPIAIWTGLCLALLLSVLFKVRSGQLPRTGTIVTVLCLSWIVHGIIIWYTVVRTLGFFLYTSLHISSAALKQEIFGMVDGTTRFALISTMSLILATILSSFGVRRQATDPDHAASSPDLN
jgi:hypothetical protein